MRGVGRLALVFCLAACQPVFVAASSDAVAISLSLSRHEEARVDARLTPQRVRLRPGEEVTLQLEIRNQDGPTRTLTLVAEVNGPSDELAVRAPATVNAPRGTTRLPVQVSARPGIVPGRYSVDIAIRGP